MAYTMVQGIGKLSLKMGVLLRGSVYKQKKVRPISQCIHNTGHLSSLFYTIFLQNFCNFTRDLLHVIS